MSDTSIRLKKSSVQDKTPVDSDLQYGELAINFNDGRLFYKNSSNLVKNFIDSDLTINLVDQKLAAAGIGDEASTIQLIRSNSVDSAEATTLASEQAIVFAIALG